MAQTTVPGIAHLRITDAANSIYIEATARYRVTANDSRVSYASFQQGLYAEFKAGEAITIASSWSRNSVTIPDRDLQVWVAILKEDGTVVREVQTVNLTSGTGGTDGDGTDVTMYATSDGTQTGTVRAGYYRIRIRVHYAQGTNDTVNGGFTCTTENTAVTTRTGTPNTWNENLTTNTRGFFHAYTDVSSINVSNTIGGSTPAPFSWPDPLSIRLNMANQLLTNDTLDADMQSTSYTNLRDFNLAAIAGSATVDSGLINLDTTDPSSFGMHVDVTSGDIGDGSGRMRYFVDSIPSGWEPAPVSQDTKVGFSKIAEFRKLQNVNAVYSLSNRFKFVNNGTNVVIDKPSGAIQNDLIVALVVYDTNSGAATITPPSGWTLITSQTNNKSFRWYQKVLGASEPSTYTWSISGASSSGYFGVFHQLYRGASTAAPIDVATSQMSGDNSLNADAASVTTLTNNTLLTTWHLHETTGDYNQSSAIYSLPSGMYRRAEINGICATVSDIFNTGFLFSYNEERRPTAGATGTRNSTTSVTSARAIAATIAIRPADATTSNTGFFSYDPTVTVDQVTNPGSNGVNHVHNRSEAVGSLSVRVRNARAETFTPRGGSDQIQISTAATSGTVEGSRFPTAGAKVTSVSKDGNGVITFTYTFGSADAIGNGISGVNKFVIWRDTNTSGTVTTNSPTPAGQQIAKLSDVTQLSTVVNPAGTSTVYNRNETQANITVNVLGADGEPWTCIGTTTFRSARIADDALEDTFSLTNSNHTTGVHTLSMTFGTSGNNAPATSGGDTKKIHWIDSSGNQGAFSSQYGALSSLMQLTEITAPGGNNIVYNRGELISGLTVKLLGARNQVFTNYVSEVFRSVNSGDSSLEESSDSSPTDPNLDNKIIISSHNNSTGVVTLDITFGISGNNAPITTAGLVKSLRWQDSSGNATATSGNYAFLSSLYDIADHLQIDNNMLNPSLNTTGRRTSELGFYSVKITNRRSQAVNGASGVISLQDDASLSPAVVSSSLTTATVNGNAGYVPLQAWDEPLPGGGWDLWASTQFTKDGNSTNESRKATGQFDFSLLARNPNLSVLVGGGPSTIGAEGNHWHPGQDLLVGVALYDAATNNLGTPDSSPAPYLNIGRFRPDLGKAEYLNITADQNGVILTAVWAELTPSTNPPPIPLIPSNLAVSGGDSRVFVNTISGAITAQWTQPMIDLFAVGHLRVGGTPYSGSVPVTVVGDGASHGNLYEVVVGGGPTSLDAHWIAGMDFQAGLTLLDSASSKPIAIDGFKEVALIRLQNSGAHAGRAEYLKTNGADPTGYSWEPITSSSVTIEFHSLTETRPNSCVYIKTWTGAQTAGWGTYDIFTLGRAKHGVYTFSNYLKELSVGTANPHEGYEFDPTGLFT